MEFGGLSVARAVPLFHLPGEEDVNVLNNALFAFSVYREATKTACHLFFAVFLNLISR